MSTIMIAFIVMCLSQARAGRRPARAWLIKITFMRTSMRACVYAPKPYICNYHKRVNYHDSIPTNIFTITQF